MKKSLVCLVLAAVLLLLCGCAAAEVAVEEIVALGMAERKPDICGQWCLEVKINGDNSPIYPNELQIFEDMTYEFGQQRGKVLPEEDTEQIFLENGEDEIIYYIFTIVEEDGFTKLLCEGDACYVRQEEHAEAVAKKAERMPKVWGQWRMELYTGSTENDYFANELQIFEDMTYEYGRQKGAICFDETGEHMYFINGEDGVRYFDFTIVEEDGFTKLLCDGQYFYVRSEEYKDVLAKKYVTLWRYTTLSEYLGELQYVGKTTMDLGNGVNAPLYMLDSLAYEKDLVYVGSYLDFAMDIVIEKKNGLQIPMTIDYPFTLMGMQEGDKILQKDITSGVIYFIREEYVEEVVLEDGNRKVVLKTGPVLDDGKCWGWDMFPEGTYDNHRY